MSGPGRGPARQEVWTVERILRWTREELGRRGVENPRLDAELLLAHALGWDRVRLYTHFDQPLSPAERAPFRELIKRRAAREPVAYILGQRDFFGRTFEVNRAVLIPRPETEHVVETALAWVRDRGLVAPRILDVGTGSGALAVSLAAELPGAQVVATDLSAPALEVARRNAERHGVRDRVELRAGDLLEPVAGEGAAFDVVVSNPPYVEEEARDDLMPEVRDYEPPEALFGGPGGLRLVERLSAGVPAVLKTPGLFACEIGAGQFERVAELLRVGGAFGSIEPVLDLGGHQRVVRAAR